MLPAVDVGKSVSRVGGKAQRAAYRAVAGDIKLGYAQFEELETFSRFGARLDEDTRKIIEHGRRIRACLKQPEFSPVSVPAQIAVLLALTAEFFDSVPLEKMTAAEHALHEAAENIPAEVCKRLNTADKLSDEDRKTIIEIARKTLEKFKPKPEAKPEPKTDVKAEPKSKAKVGSKPEVKAKSDSKPNESKPEPLPGREQKSKEDTQPKTKLKEKSDPEVKTEPNPGPKVKTKLETKPDVQTEVNPKHESEEKA
jgi:F-type H+-transporting ATPase subunit alpha